MPEDLRTQRPFRIFEGGRSKRLQIGGIPLSLVTTAGLPFPIDGQVCEEDRFLVMEASEKVEPHHEHPLRIINRAWEQAPLPVGSIQPRSDNPKRFLAVVHDLDRTPTCRPIWILAALAALKHELTTNTGIDTLAMPLLGVRHGPLTVRESLGLLFQAMVGERWPLEHLCLQISNEELSPALDYLLSYNQQPGPTTKT
jgi:hypothetical protein